MHRDVFGCVCVLSWQARQNQHLSDVLQDQRLVARHTEATLSGKRRKMRALNGRKKDTENNIVMFSESKQNKTKQRNQFIRNKFDGTTQKLSCTTWNSFECEVLCYKVPPESSDPIASPFSNSAILRMQTRELSSYRITNLRYGIRGFCKKIRRFE